MLAATNPEQLKLKATQSRGLLLQGYKTQVEVSLEPQDKEAKFPVSAVLEKLLSADSWFSTLTGSASTGLEERLLVNLRGRPAESFGNQISSSAASQPAPEELILVEGEIFEPDKNGQDDANGEKPELYRFSSSLQSRFKCYQDSKHIIHSLNHHLPKVLQGVVEEYDFLALSRLIPAEIKKIRFGIELYKPHWLGGMLGSSLAIRDRLYLEVESSKIWLKIDQASGAAAGVLPFEEEKLVFQISQTLKELEIISDLYDRLSSSIGTK